MPEPAYNIADEQRILERLADAHQEWRDQRPSPPPREDTAAALARVWHKIKHPEPQDVELIRAACVDPLGTVIQSQLSVVGWRLYAKGGADVLNSVYVQIERDRHPGFAWAVHRAWADIGFSGDPRGTWNGTALL